MNRWVVAWLVVSGLCLDVHAQELPIRIDTSRNAAVYIKQIEQGAGYKLLSETTPATYNAQPGETIDIKVTTPHGFFFRWEGDRQNVPGPANVTVRMDRKLAWDRVALAGGGAAIALLGLFFAWRRRVAAESLVARSQIMALTERVASAERVGALGRTLGNYKVLAKLGAGAMGVVYKVESPSGDIFAAKVPNEMDARVVREAEVSKSLRAPNIVESYGLVEGEPSFLLMEYLEGQTLHDWMARNARLPLARIDDLVRQLLDAIEVAHCEGVFHRDIKPENIFLAQAGGREILKVMDFGLASTINAARLTQTGFAMGTPIYASPEQLSGNPIDATTDLYSVGVFIYELATGALPWKQTDPVALTLQKYKALPKEPIALRPDLPMAWNQLVVDLLSGDSQKRPQDVAEVKRRWNDGTSLISRVKD